MGTERGDPAGAISFFFGLGHESLAPASAFGVSPFAANAPVLMVCACDFSFQLLMVRRVRLHCACTYARTHNTHVQSQTQPAQTRALR